MKVYSEPEHIREVIRSWKDRCEKVVLVPTMGHLHQGHTSLIEQAQALGERVIVSIFVNPIQFNQQDDFTRYPRTLESDLTLLSTLDVDAVFAPSTETLYQRGTQSALKIIVPELAQMFDGEFRPGHFEGVCTVVCKLFNITCPNIAVFGNKDYQQLLIIRRLVSELNFDIDIVAGETVREADGLAMSSRNTHLSPEQRSVANCLYTSLQRVKTDFTTDSIAELEQSAVIELENAGMKVEYFNIRDARNLQPVSQITEKIVVLSAVWLGETRLIDNILFSTT